jgi:hypothetical protein
VSIREIRVKKLRAFANSAAARIPPRSELSGVALVRRVLRVSGSIKKPAGMACCHPKFLGRRHGIPPTSEFAPVPPEQLKLLWTAVTCHRFQSADLSAHSKDEHAGFDATFLILIMHN